MLRFLYFKNHRYCTNFLKCVANACYNDTFIEYNLNTVTNF